MNVAVVKTKAEQGFAEQFEKAAPKLPGDDAVKAARAQAIGRFSAIGLPHRRVEEYKYTDLRAALKEAYPLAPEGTVDAAAIDRALGPGLSKIDAVRLTFVNGRFAEQLSTFDAERDRGYFFDSLVRGLTATSEAEWPFDWLKTRLANQKGPKGDAIVTLNTAFARDGAIVRVADGVALSKPLHFVFVSASAAPTATFVRNMVGIGKGASATVIESHVNLNGAPVQNNVAAEIAVRAGARLDHIKTTREGVGATHLSSAFVEIETGGSYRGFQFTDATALVRNQSFVTFTGEGGQIDLSGVFLARGNEHIDTTLVIDHAVPRCTSRELFKGVLQDDARGVFQGKIIVRPDAQKTDGKQMAHALMLSPTAEFDSKPELEIYADDVVCGHGTTSAQLDDDMLFYCKSRGIPEAEARALLIESFVGEALDKVEHEGTRQALSQFANEWLRGAASSRGA